MTDRHSKRHPTIEFAVPHPKDNLSKRHKEGPFLPLYREERPMCIGDCIPPWDRKSAVYALMGGNKHDIYRVCSPFMEHQKRNIDRLVGTVYPKDDDGNYIKDEHGNRVAEEGIPPWIYDPNDKDNCFEGIQLVKLYRIRSAGPQGVAMVKWYSRDTKVYRLMAEDGSLLEMKTDNDRYWFRERDRNDRDQEEEKEEQIQEKETDQERPHGNEGEKEGE
jgi:hypothetical protein